MRIKEVNFDLSYEIQPFGIDYISLTRDEGFLSFGADDVIFPMYDWIPVLDGDYVLIPREFAGIEKLIL